MSNVKGSYNGNRKLVDPETGEVVYAKTITKTTMTPFDFYRVQLIDLLTGLLNFKGEKTMQIYLYVMTQFAKHPKTNKIHMTYNDIVRGMENKGIKVGWRTVAGAIRHLEQVRVGKGHNTFLRRKRYGRYGRKSCLMINPEISLGKGGKFNNLLIKYKNMDSKSHRKPKHAKQTELISKQYGKARHSSLYAKKNSKPTTQVQHSHNASDLMANSPLEEDKQKTAQK